jgi:hypothetical protein
MWNMRHSRNIGLVSALSPGRASPHRGSAILMEWGEQPHFVFPFADTTCPISSCLKKERFHVINRHSSLSGHIGTLYTFGGPCTPTSNYYHSAGKNDRRRELSPGKPVISDIFRQSKIGTPVDKYIAEEKQSHLTCILRGVHRRNM